MLDFKNSSSTLWTVDSRIVDIIQCSYIILLCYLIKKIRMYYSLFVFRFCYKIIGLSSLNLAGRGLTHLWPTGMCRAWYVPGLERAGLARLGPNINGLGWVLNSTLWAWAGLGLTHFCRPGKIQLISYYLS